jgi:hypothetical protein
VIGVENSDELSVEQWQYQLFTRNCPPGTDTDIIPQFSQQGWRILKVHVYAGDAAVTLTGTIINSTHGGEALVVAPGACFVFEPRGYTSLEAAFTVSVAAGSTNCLFVVEYLFKTVPGNVIPDIVHVP